VIERSEVMVELAHSCDTEAKVLDMVEGSQEDCALVQRRKKVVVMLSRPLQPHHPAKEVQRKSIPLHLTDHLD
jgi:hypothetical protein